MNKGKDKNYHIFLIISLILLSIITIEVYTNISHHMNGGRTEIMEEYVRRKNEFGPEG